MHLSARRVLPLQPDALVRTVAGDILTFSSKPLEASFLHAYSSALEPLWHITVSYDSICMIARGERLWVFDRTGMAAYGLDGSPVRRVDFGVPEGMRVGGAVPVESGFVIAMEHDEERPVGSPVVARIDEAGKVMWKSTLPIGALALERHGRCLFDRQAFSTRINVTTWQCSYGTGGTLVTSGNAVLVVFKDLPESGIGMGYVLSLDDGTFRYATEMGPIKEVAAGLEDGAFVVGFQGYGILETFCYEADGALRDRWASHGHYVVGADDIRVVELRNDNGMHVARLVAGGRVVRGARLRGYYTSRPWLAPDGQLLFFRQGVVYSIREISVAERLAVFDRDDRVFSTEMQGGSGCVYVGFTRHRLPVKPDGTLDSESHLVRVDLS